MNALGLISELRKVAKARRVQAPEIAAACMELARVIESTGYAELQAESIAIVMAAAVALGRLSVAGCKCDENGDGVHRVGCPALKRD